MTHGTQGVQTMELINQVCSLESAKKLKELGFPQSSLFYWFVDCSGREPYLVNHSQYPFKSCGCKEYSAFTTAELGELLPDTYQTSKITGALTGKVTWQCWRLYASLRHIIYENTEAEARAKMLIHLASNGLMEIPKQFSGHSTETPKGDV